MTVTEIKLRGERAKVTFGDGTAVESTKQIASRLKCGEELTDGEYASFCAESSHACARLRAVELISRRDMSRAELRRKLIERGSPEADAGRAVDWLVSHGYVSDERYAGLIVRHYASKGYGAARIRTELSRRGVPRELWGEALEGLGDTSAAADAFLRRRLRGGYDEKAVKRATDAMCRRGFSWEEIRAALERVRAELEE